VLAEPILAEPGVPIAELAPAPPDPIPEPIPEPVVESSSPPAEPIPVSPAVAAPADQPDDLLRLKGVGPKLNTLLIDLGVTSYARIAGWTDADIAAIDARLGNFKGRPIRDQWVDQAGYLARGDIAGFEAKYGKL
jgi:predicted flap endonuclease-1-like 5' DNA nuclease